MAKTGFALIHPNESKLVFSSLNEGIEDVMDLHTERDSYIYWRNFQKTTPQPKILPGDNTYINPDVRGLLVNDVRLRAAGNGLPTVPPQSRVVCDRDEEGRWQENQL